MRFLRKRPNRMAIVTLSRGCRVPTTIFWEKKVEKRAIPIIKSQPGRGEICQAAELGIALRRSRGQSVPGKQLLDA
jgi:hypothetical protein